MSFANTPLLSLLIFIPLAIVFLVWRHRQRATNLQKLGQVGLLTDLSNGISEVRRATKSILWLVTIFTLIIAIARPTWGFRAELIEKQGVAIVFVLDVSASMNVQDVTPSRLERAKLAIRDFLQNLEGNEFGLTLFAGTAFSQFPLTTDIRSALNFVNAASSESITRQGTDIDAAIRVAMNSLEAHTAVERFIIVLSDGENFDGEPLIASGEASENNITIYTIGYGTEEGGPVPRLAPDGSIQNYRTDEANNLIISSLDKTILEAMADLTGGAYQRASSNNVEVFNLINHINAAEQRTLNTQVETRGIERFAIFIVVALLALSLEILLPETKGE